MHGFGSRSGPSLLDISNRRQDILHREGWAFARWLRTSCGARARVRGSPRRADSRAARPRALPPAADTTIATSQPAACTTTVASQPQFFLVQKSCREFPDCDQSLCHHQYSIGIAVCCLQSDLCISCSTLSANLHLRALACAWWA